MKRLHRKRLSVAVFYCCSLFAGDDASSPQQAHNSQEELMAMQMPPTYGGTTYNILTEGGDVESQGSDLHIALTYEDIAPEPNRLWQGVSTGASWLVGIIAVPLSVLSCCSYNPGKIMDACNPLHRRYVGSFRAETDDSCDQARYMCCPCVYKNQRPVYEEGEPS